MSGQGCPGNYKCSNYCRIHIHNSAKQPTRGVGCDGFYGQHTNVTNVYKFYLVKRLTIFNKVETSGKYMYIYVILLTFNKRECIAIKQLIQTIFELLIKTIYQCLNFIYLSYTSHD
jgi:hypothetical protein